MQEIINRLCRSNKRFSETLLLFSKTVNELLLRIEALELKFNESQKGQDEIFRINNVGNNPEVKRSEWKPEAEHEKN